MITNFIKSRKKRINWSFRMIVVLVTILTFSMAVSAQNDQFQLAPKEQLQKFYAMQFKYFYDSIPADIFQKYSTTISRVDEMLVNNDMAGTITSKTVNFDLDYYGQTIKVGIIPYLDRNDSFRKELSALVNNIDAYTIDWERLDENNKILYGNNLPLPTTFAKSSGDDTVKTSLNGSGYNVTNAVKYAYQWTQNGKELRNSNYNYYAGKNDCTNFVSQVLHDSSAGKIGYVRKDTWGWDYDDSENWYYANGWLDPPSWTWGGAYNLYGHLASYSSNVKRLYSWSDVKVGDIVQWDLNPNDQKFYIDHSTVVTKIQNNIIYLTYHTTDKEDEPISTFTNAGYIGYAWAINH